MSYDTKQEMLLRSSIEVASKGWISFDWTSKRKQWDTAASQSKEARELSVAARKKLADTTKKFKRSVKTVETAGNALSSSQTPETVTGAVKSIDALAKDCRVTVKSYQEEIDNLTRRCKAAENSFSGLTQTLMEMPDPAAVLSASLDQIGLQKKQMAQLMRTVDEMKNEMNSMEQNSKSRAASETGHSKQEKEELIQLRREVAEYEVEFRSLKNQDITIRKLESRIVELQESGETEFEDKLEKAKQELVETEGRRTMEALEREAAMERKVHSLELQLKAEVAGRAATQAHWLEADEGAGEREAAFEAQRKILVDDAERLRMMLHEATRERDELRLRVAATQSGGRSSTAPQSGGIAMTDLLNERQAYEAEVAELSHTANSLREELRLKDELMVEEKTNLRLRVEELEQKEIALNTNLASLESHLAAAPSQSLLDSMKRELRILKRLEYNAEDFDLDRDPEKTGRNEGEEQDLETVLVAKLRRMEAELVKERNQNTDTEKEKETLSKELDELLSKKDETERLIATLEADLDRATASTSQASLPEKPRETEAPLAVERDGSILQSVMDPDAPLPPPQPAQGKQAVKASAAEKAQDDHSVATIIMAQRDRLRARCDALEAERDSFKRELQGQVQAAESLKADNTKLFEKMRYLQSYNGSSSSSGHGSRARLTADRDLDLEALEQRYEASVDPFRQFGRTERQRKLQGMSPMERTVFVVAKAFLGSKEMRTFLFFYILAMHLLVFLTTYHWSHNASGCSTEQDEMLSHLPPQNDKTRGEMIAQLTGSG